MTSKTFERLAFGAAGRFLMHTSEEVWLYSGGESDFPKGSRRAHSFSDDDSGSAHAPSQSVWVGIPTGDA